MVCLEHSLYAKLKKKKKKKNDVRQENGVSPLKAENNRGVTNDVMFASAHEKIKYFFLFWAFILSFLWF